MTAEERIKFVNDIVDLKIASTESTLTSYMHLFGVLQGQMQCFKFCAKSMQISGYSLIENYKQHKAYEQNVEKLAYNFGKDAEDFIATKKRIASSQKKLKKINEMRSKSEKVQEDVLKKLEDLQRTFDQINALNKKMQSEE